MFYSVFRSSLYIRDTNPLLKNWLMAYKLFLAYKFSFFKGINVSVSPLIPEYSQLGHKHFPG